MKEEYIKRSFWESTKKFSEPCFKYRLITFKSIIYYSIWAINPIIHVIFAQKLVWFIEKKDKYKFLLFLYFYIGFIILYEFLSYLTRKWWWVENVNFYRKVVHWEYVKKFVWLNNTEIEKVGTWKLVSLVWTWMDNWVLFLDKVFENLIKIIFTIAFLFFMIFSFNIFYWIIFVFLYLIVHIIWEIFNKKTLLHRRKRQDTWNSYTSQLVKILMSKFEILQTYSSNKEIDKLDQITDKLVNYNLLMSTPNHWFYHIPQIFITIVKFLILWYLWYEVIKWTYTLDLFVWLFWMLSLMDSVITNSMRFYSDFTNNFTKVEKLWDFFDTTPEIQWYETWKDFIYKTWAIELQNINFWYSENKKVFKNFNLNLAWWKITAFVWNSWWWKTTLVKIISQYIKQDNWKVLIDWQDLEEVSLKSYYKNIWYLTQEPSVFDWSIYDNLTYALEENNVENKNVGNENIRSLQDKIHEIIKLSKCEFIYDFEKWLETEIGERWVRLSWWQRQRLAIAKIMLKDPKIIILDEPTSALDSFSEELITKAMNNLFTWRTVLVIAHRLQTVKHADEIIVIDNWEIQERGTHDELVEKNWIYNRMLELQSGF